VKIQGVNEKFRQQYFVPCRYQVALQDTLLDFYLQCIPEAVRMDSEFNVFITSELIQSLPMKLPISEFVAKTQAMAP